MFRKFKALSTTKKVAGGLMLCAILAIAAGGGSPQQSKSVQLNAQPTNSGQVKDASTITSNSPSAQITTKTVTETQTIPYQITTQNDASLPKGQSQIVTAGVNGTETLTYTITYTNGQQTDKQLVSKVITTPSINQVTAIGTYVAPIPAAKPATHTPTPKASCSPLTDGGNCYEPGEYCRDTDHGVVGVAGDGESIVCTDNDGWRWEPR